jgi:peptidoglycan/LPS O-acetylase OafA/YrhL
MIYSNNSLSNLEKWRGLLSVIVLFGHILQIFLFPVIGIKGYFQSFFGLLSNLSVVVFFFLSGMLICLSAKNISSSNNGFNWIKYLVNRVARIYPALIVSIVLGFILIHLAQTINSTTSIQKIYNEKYLARESFMISTRHFILSFFMVNSDFWKINGPIWSLIIEWWLYISGLFFFLFISQKKYKVIYILLAVFFCYLAIDKNKGFFNGNIYYAIIWYLGVLYTLNSDFRNTIEKVSATIINVLLVLSFIGLFFAKELELTHVYGILQIVFSLTFLKSLLNISLPKYFIKVAQYSYTLYIVHFPILLFAFTFLHRYTSSNYYILFITSVGLFFFVLFLSDVIAKYAEQKNYFREKIFKVIDKILLLKL